MHPKAEVFNENFPFLARHWNLSFIKNFRVSRVDTNLLSKRPKIRIYADGTHAWNDRTLIIDKNGGELVRVGYEDVPCLKPLWKRIFSKEKIESWSKRELFLGEQIGEALLRLKDLGKLDLVAFIVEDVEGILVVYKFPRGVDVPRWIMEEMEKIHEKQALQRINMLQRERKLFEGKTRSL